jgi:hypothetical protein
MAKLQGYFVQYAESFESAILNVGTLRDSTNLMKIEDNKAYEATQREGLDIPFKKTNRMQGVRRLTVEEIDKMVFNPQDGWDRDIRELK